MLIAFIEADSFTLDKLFNENLVSWFRISAGKAQIAVYNHSVEAIDIFFLFQERQLFW